MIRMLELMGNRWTEENTVLTDFPFHPFKRQ